MQETFRPGGSIAAITDSYRPPQHRPSPKPDGHPGGPDAPSDKVNDFEKEIADLIAPEAEEIKIDEVQLPTEEVF